MKRIFKENIKKLRKVLGIKLYRDYIKEVHHEWWGGKNEICCKNGLSFCIDNIPDENSADNEWHCCPYWQRKLTNKIQAREFALRNYIPVPELYWYGKNVDDIPFERLPASYVIKTSFGSASKQVIPICNGYNIFNNQECSPEQIRQFFREPMSKVAPYGYLMVEELLRPAAGNTQSKDYKCHVFAGNLAFIEVIDRIKGTDTWYLPGWSAPPHEMRAGKFKKPSYEERPGYYDQLVEYAEKLGMAYGPEYIRIDFYITDRGCVFGEFTATPSGGGNITPYADRILGKLWNAMLRARA